MAEYLQKTGIPTEADDEGAAAAEHERRRRRVDGSARRHKGSTASERLGLKIDRMMQQGRPIFVLLCGAHLPLLLNQCPYEVVKRSRMPPSTFVSLLYEAMSGANASPLIRRGLQANGEQPPCCWRPWSRRCFS
ncbi:hypothetical protein [Phytohabitans aurantiacus]|uniref:Uncharacterized protein n=1 Tax=Phytohabitans aurantiacus TaxID=3016789 RepID=A0ABQ5R3D0_9ACTN|nr:hypothetical protein [Phytohabitans aurantiacus]GLI01058.1 hypothetical protein Pa4123_63340 [Phytohabitans aurantiacus]